VPIFLALYFRRSIPRPTMISSAPETTWLAVRIYPSGLTITPEPRPCRVCLPCLCGSWPPKNWRNVSSPNGNAVCPRETVCVVNTVTTLGATFSTIGANVLISPCCEGLGSCAAAENARRYTHTIVPINNSTRGRKISLCIKRLCSQRESRAQPHPDLFCQNGSHRSQRSCDATVIYSAVIAWGSA